MLILRTGVRFERVEVSLVSDSRVILKKLSTLFLCFGLFFILDCYFKDLKPPFIVIVSYADYFKDQQSIVSLMTFIYGT